MLPELFDESVKNYGRSLSEFKRYLTDKGENIQRDYSNKYITRLYSLWIEIKSIGGE